MKPFITSAARWWLLGALAIVALVSLAPAQGPDSAPMNQLLAQAKTQAAQLATEADQMTSYTRSTDTWQSHATQVTVIKEHINALGKTLQQMEDGRASAAPWQQEAVDRIVPLAKELASSLDTTINHINQNKNQLGHADYRDYLQANAEMAQDIAALIKDYAAYGQHKEAYEKLGEKLETPGN